MDDGWFIGRLKGIPGVFSQGETLEELEDIEIQLTNNDKPTWWQSKFGGLPYLPKDFEYPI